MLKKTWFKLGLACAVLLITHSLLYVAGRYGSQAKTYIKIVYAQKIQQPILKVDEEKELVGVGIALRTKKLSGDELKNQERAKAWLKGDTSAWKHIHTDTTSIPDARLFIFEPKTEDAKLALR